MHMEDLFCYHNSRPIAATLDWINQGHENWSGTKWLTPNGWWNENSYWLSKASKSKYVQLHRNYNLFHNCALKLWNSLPKSLKRSETVTVFKKKLKTFHLFCDYFNRYILDGHTILPGYFFCCLLLYKVVVASHCKRIEDLTCTDKYFVIIIIIIIIIIIGIWARRATALPVSEIFETFWANVDDSGKGTWVKTC